MDAKQDEVDSDGDRLVGVHHRPGHRLIVEEQIRQQALLVRRIAKRVPRCNAIKHRNIETESTRCSAVIAPKDFKKLMKLTFWSNFQCSLIWLLN